MKVLFRAELDTGIMPNITIEDAKVLTIIDDTYYAAGLLNHKNDMEVLYKDGRGREATFTYPIKPETTSINIEDMIDKENSPIFASLDHENGIGGDILKTRGYSATCFYQNGFNIETIMGLCYLPTVMDKTLVVGIQK